MLFTFTGSSDRIPAWSVIESPPPKPAAALDPLSEWTFDEPLPVPAPVDEIHLLAQSPFKIFLYWDTARDPRETLSRTIFGGHDYQLVVRLTDTARNETTIYEATEGREQFFDVLPGRSYLAEIGFFAPRRPFIRLLTSDEVETPRSGVARRTSEADEAEDFRVSAEEFTRVLDESGYVSDALEVALEAADELMRASFTRIVAGSFTGADASLFDDEDVIELRRFLSAFAFGAPVERLRPMFSPRVAGWFDESFAHFSSQQEAARLVEILRLAFGLEITASDAASVFAHEPARASLGASDVRLPGGRPAHLWLPSMTAGRMIESLTLLRAH